MHIATTNNDIEERQLLSQIASDKDQDALEQLYSIFRPRVCMFLRRVTTDSSVIDEAFNEIMYIVWSKASSYKGKSKVSSWIFGIAYHVCNDRMKNQHRFEKLVDKIEHNQRSHPTDTNFHSEVSIQQLIAVSLEKLPVKQKLVLELHHFMGFSIKEIADIVNIPNNTVKSRLHNARHQLRRNVQNLENTTSPQQQ